MAIGSTALYNFIIVLIVGVVIGIGLSRRAHRWLPRISGASGGGDVTSALVGIAGAFIGFHVSVIIGLLPSPLMHFVLAALASVVIVWLWRGR